MLAERMRQSIDAATSAPSRYRHAALVALGHGYLQFARSEPARYELMFGPRLNEDNRFEELEVAARSAVKVLDDELKRASPTATREERRDAGIALWAAVHGLASLIRARRVRVSDAKFSGYVQRLLHPLVVGIVENLPNDTVKTLG
jgi:hypothetical protein